MKHTSLILAVGLALLTACNSSKQSKELAVEADEITLATCPAFDADSAFSFIQQQCKFGPRVPGTPSSRLCGDFLVESFKRFGATVEEQTTTVLRYDKEQTPVRNIIARVNPEAPQRILVCAHWDSRPWADNDNNEAHHHTPILGANDGASGVAVMLEICRLTQQQPLSVGVDFVCFDAEDLGVPEWDEDYEGDSSDTWCLGSAYWAEQAANAGYKARYGILLDMVGGRGATFSREMVSRHYADPIVEQFWTLGRKLGYSQFFPLRDGGYLTDDHVNVNRIARIPCIDIVPYFQDGPSSFGPTWHTMQDTPENIDTNVLKAVGQTLTQMLYNEK